MNTAAATALRHDIDAIRNEVIIVQQPEGPVRYARAEHPIRPGYLSQHTFRRVDGGYSASAVHLAEAGFTVEPLAEDEDADEFYRQAEADIERRYGWGNI